MSSRRSDQQRQDREDQRGHGAVEAHGDAGEGAGLLADLEGAGGADPWLAMPTAKPRAA